jgi:hypothetical protein
VKRGELSIQYSSKRATFLGVGLLFSANSFVLYIAFILESGGNNQYREVYVSCRP